MSENDGKQLERLVELIERSQLRSGFEVETRRPVFNEDGDQIAELDILVTGKVGSATVRFLIECRDRPSEGSAPVSWVEQLVGRRQRLKLDKVMAVSSTGFAPGAKTFAEDSGIELRSLDNLTYKDVASWLPNNAPLIIRDGRFHAVRVGLPHDGDHDEAQQIPFNADEQLFRHRESGEIITLLDIWKKIINDNRTWDGVEEGGAKKDVTISVRPDILSEYVFQLDDSELDLGFIEFDATLVIAVPTMPLAQAAQYVSQPANGDQEETLVKLGRWVGKDSDPVEELIFLGIPKKDGEDT